MRPVHPSSPACSNFAARVVTDGTRPMVEVHGEIDVATADEFAAAIDGALGDGRQIEIDLRHTTFMASAGLAVLIRTYLRLGQIPDAIVLREPPPCVRRVLQVAGIEHLVTINHTGQPEGMPMAANMDGSRAPASNGSEQPSTFLKQAETG